MLQDSERERWLLINIDKREYVETFIDPAHWEDAIDVNSPLFEYLTPLTPPPQTGATKYTPAQGTRNGILDLPEKLLHMLVRAIASPSDAVCLGLACDLFATVAYERAVLLAAPWAGDRVVRVRADVPAVDMAEMHVESDGTGTGAAATQMRCPADMFTGAEQRELCDYRATALSPTLHAFLQSRYTRMDSVRSLPYDISLPMRITSPHDALRYEGWIHSWETRIKDGLDNDRLVLRNMSKKQFLRARDLRTLRTELGLSKWQLGLAHVVLKRVYWRTGAKGGKGTVAAVWAGDRLEITETQDEAGWVDVYEEVRGEYLRHTQGALREIMAEGV